MCFFHHAPPLSTAPSFSHVCFPCDDCSGKKAGLCFITTHKQHRRASSCEYFSQIVNNLSRNMQRPVPSHTRARYVLCICVKNALRSRTSHPYSEKKTAGLEKLLFFLPATTSSRAHNRFLCVLTCCQTHVTEGFSQLVFRTGSCYLPHLFPQPH